MKRKLFLFLLVLIIVYIYKINSTEITIPDESIRLRVIPSSNNSKDINVKEQVKDYLETDIYFLLKDTTNIEDARSIINKNISNIDKNVADIFNNNNYHESYQVNFGSNYFPEKTYKGTVYKEGYYESLVISIGEAKGDNWWCVLFPNFCQVDTSEKHTYKSYFKELINKMLKNS